MAREQHLTEAVLDRRECRWKVAFGRKSRSAYCTLELLDLAGVALAVGELRTFDDPLATTMADAYEKLASQLPTDPPMPAEPELVMRHSDGENDDRTDRCIPAIDNLELTELSRNQDAPAFLGAAPRRPTTGEI